MWRATHVSEPESLNRSVPYVEPRRDRRAARLFDPNPAPLREIGRRAAVEDVDQIGPGRVAERVRFQVLAQPVAKARLAHHALEMTHDDRRLLINDRAVQA